VSKAAPAAAAPAASPAKASAAAAAASGTPVLTSSSSKGHLQHKLSASRDLDATAAAAAAKPAAKRPSLARKEHSRDLLNGGGSDSDSGVFATTEIDPSLLTSAAPEEEPDFASSFDPQQPPPPAEDPPVDETIVDDYQPIKLADSFRVPTLPDLNDLADDDAGANVTMFADEEE
jgi:hypothetical protein